MKKQTAVEWLFAHLLPFLNDNGFVDPQENEHFFKCLAEAKAMEKEQIIDAAYEFMGTNFDPNKGRAELYYKGTYGGDK